MSWITKKDLVHTQSGTVPANIAIEFEDDYTILTFLGRVSTTIRVPLNENGNCSIKDFFLPAYFAIDDYAYGGKYWFVSPHIFLQNVVKRRLRMILGCDKERFYVMPSTELLRLDLVNWSQFVLYQRPQTPNAKLKFSQRVVVLRRYKDIGTYNDNIPTEFQCLGDCLRPEYTTRTQEEIAQDVTVLKPSPMNATSPSKGIYLLPKKGNKPNYLDAPGYLESEDRIKSIFGSAIKLTERTKMAVATDAVAVQNPHKPLLRGDRDEVDPCLINALVVFDEAHDVNSSKPLHLVTGEMPCSKRFAETICYPRAVKQVLAEEITVGEGEVIDRNGVVGIYEEEPVVIETDFVSYTVESITKMDGLNFWKMVIVGNTPLAVSRIVSPCGIKGVTVPKASLGHIIVNGKKVGVQLVAGPTNIKAGTNTIALAKLGLKARLSKTSYAVNQMTAEEINLEIADVGLFEWHQPDGTVKKVHAGVLPIYVTVMGSEVCTTGTSQKVMPETLLMFARDNHPEIIDELITMGSSPRHFEAFEELLKMRYDNGSVDETLPVYTTDNPQFRSMISNGIIDASTFGGAMISNPLLSETNKGFYLVIANAVVRMPSARIINMMTEIIRHTGEVRRPQFFGSASRILINVRQSAIGQANTAQIISNISAYYGDIISELSGKGGLVNRICTPVIWGISALQIADWRVPMGETVVLHPKMQKRLNKGAYVEIGVRNPVLWRSQLDARPVLSQKDFENYCAHMGYDINDIIVPELGHCAVLRNPWDILMAQGDCDGDLAPVVIPGEPESKIQELLSDFATTCHPIKEEQAWIDKYIAGELDNSVLNGEIQFTWHTHFKSDYYTNGLIPSAAAKMMIGPATTSKWLLEAAIEAFAIKEKHIPAVRFAISALLQDCVVRGIKHSTAGDFTNFLQHRIVRTNTHKVVIEMMRKTGITDSAIQEFLNSIAKLSPEFEFGRKAEELRGVIGIMTGSVQSRDRFTGEPREFSLGFLTTDAFEKLPHRFVLSQIKRISDGVFASIKPLTASELLGLGGESGAEIKRGGVVEIEMESLDDDSMMIG